MAAAAAAGDIVKVMEHTFQYNIASYRAVVSTLVCFVRSFEHTESGLPTPKSNPYPFMYKTLIKFGEKTCRIFGAHTHAVQTSARISHIYFVYVIFCGLGDANIIVTVDVSSLGVENVGLLFVYIVYFTYFKKST